MIDWKFIGWSRLLLGAIAAIVLAVSVPPVNCATGPTLHASRRLPLNVVPVSYQLYFEPNLVTSKFTGTEQLKVKVETEAPAIILNSQDLTIESAELSAQRDSGSNVLSTKMNLVAEDSLLEIVPEKPIKPGIYQLRIRFSGKLNDKLVGFYRSTFKDSAGKRHNLAVTQMEPTDARRMFPCFDEPSFKATFRLSVKTAPGFTAVTNAPVERQTQASDGSTTYHFAATPPMSSYLVALVVGELQPTPAVRVQGVPVRVWSVKGRTRLGVYARDEAAKLLPILTRYFGIAYPWTKLDLIAIPDFEAGAMENPGAITFRETLLLIDPATSASHTRRASSSVIAHEMAHLWFGDLVTMKWWDDLWLNEAFATWMAVRAVDKLHPDWEHWKDYAEDRVAALETDGLKSTRAIHADVANPEQAHEMFDVITYEKGSAILRMLERFVGEANFQAGVHNYLKKHEYSNASTGDLWESIGEAAQLPVRQVMDGWVRQPGYPLISLSRQQQPGYIAAQQRFFEHGEEPADPTLWQVPIGLRALESASASSTQTQASQTDLLTSKSAALTAATSHPESFILANAGGVGYYRTRYPVESYSELINSLAQSTDPAERLAVLDDTWTLAKTGDLGIDTYLNMITALRSEKDEMVWTQMISQLETVDYFVDAQTRPAFEKFVRAQLQPIAKSLGWQARAGELQQTRMLRGRILTALGTFGNDTEVIARARKLFNQARRPDASSKGTAIIETDLREPISRIVAYNGTAADFDYIKRLSDQASTPEIYISNLLVLARFRDPALVDRALSMSVSGKLRNQDAPNLLGIVLSRRDANRHAWEFIEAHWAQITSLYPEEMVPRVVARAASFNTLPDYQRVKAFVSTHRIKSGTSTVARMLEHVEINVRFRNTAAARLNDWLKQHYGNV